MKDIRWRTLPALGGYGVLTADVDLREKPGSTYPAVGTHATLSIMPDLERSVRWSVLFHRYVPRRPLEARMKKNETTGAMIEIPPPPIIPERRVGDRISYEPGGLEAAIEEAKKRCEETVRAGRPS